MYTSTASGAAINVDDIIYVFGGMYLFGDNRDTFQYFDLDPPTSSPTIETFNPSKSPSIEPTYVPVKVTCT